MRTKCFGRGQPWWYPTLRFPPQPAKPAQVGGPGSAQDGAPGIVVLLLIVLTTFSSNAQISKKQEKLNAQHADAIAAARTAAEAWLKIEDAQTYDKSWQAASDYFRSQVPEQGWVKRMQTMRKAIDPVLMRDLQATEWNTELPNLPKGEYVAFVYQTTFADGHPQAESVVMVHEGANWKMVGYAVQ